MKNKVLSLLAIVIVAAVMLILPNTVNATDIDASNVKVETTLIVHGVILNVATEDETFYNGTDEGVEITISGEPTEQMINENIAKLKAWAVEQGVNEEFCQVYNELDEDSIYYTYEGETTPIDNPVIINGETVEPAAIDEESEQGEEPELEATTNNTVIKHQRYIISLYAMQRAQVFEDRTINLDFTNGKNIVLKESEFEDADENEDYYKNDKMMFWEIVMAIEREAWDLISADSDTEEDYALYLKIENGKFVITEAGDALLKLEFVESGEDEPGDVVISAVKTASSKMTETAKYKNFTFPMHNYSWGEPLEAAEIIKIGDPDYIFPYMPYMDLGMYKNLTINIAYGTITVPEYTILDGANQTYIPGSGLRIRASGDINNFLALKVDGEIISEDYYILESGSTIATLKDTYLATLSAGDHTVTFVYTNGEVSTNFTVPSTETTEEADDTTVSSNPKTGDSINAYMVLLTMATLGMVATMVIKRKNTKK